VVYVRNVSRGPRRPEAIAALAQDVVEQDSALVLAEDTLSMARHAAERGWIRPEALDGIQEERERDEGPPGLIERLVGEEEGPGPLTISGRSPGPAGQG
jgi:hypothetical protein